RHRAGGARPRRGAERGRAGALRGRGLRAKVNALVWLGPREMAWREEPLPEPAAGQVRLRVEAVGICGSELSGYLGHNSLRVPPLVMGHEFSGVVEAVGPAAGAEASGAGDALPGRAAAVGVGDRVVVNPLLSCGECGFCVGG